MLERAVSPSSIKDQASSPRYRSRPFGKTPILASATLRFSIQKPQSGGRQNGGPAEGTGPVSVARNYAFLLSLAPGKLFPEERDAPNYAFFCDFGPADNR